MKKAVGYIRNGTKAEEKRQRESIEAYCKGKGYEIAEWFRDDFEEVAYGNWMGHRRITAVVADRYADVTGDVFTFYAYRCRLLVRGCDLEIVRREERFEGYGLYSKILDRFTEKYCEMEIAHDPVHRSNKRVRKASKGEYIGGQAPMGYRVSGGKLEVNPEEVPVVLFIMEEKHAGRTKLGTVEKLNARGFKTRRGGKFQISTVQGIWNNEDFYRGYCNVKGELVKGLHEAILKD